MILKSLFGKKGAQKIPEVQNTSASPSAMPVSNASAPAPGAPSAADEPPAASQLEEAMVENARADTQESRDRVYQELLFSDLLLALAELPEGEAPPAEPGNMSIAILNNGQGMNFAAAFTSASAARAWRNEGGQYVSVRGQDIFKLLEPSPADVIVINPGGAPFIVLPKVDYRQLAAGVVPQNPRSPVQGASGVAGAEGAAGAPAAEGGQGEGQMQVAFPPDVFNEEQKAHSSKVMEANPCIEAAVLGAILPPGAPENGWLRTVFLRVRGVEENPDSMQNFCMKVRETIVGSGDLFKEMNFEVGVMPDLAFWEAMHQNKVILFDKNPAPAQGGAPASP